MSEQHITINKETWRRLARIVRSFLTSEVRWQARGMFAVLIAFALAVNVLNVVNSYVGGNLMTAIEHRDWTDFVRQSVLYVVVFAATTTVAVYYRYIEERLGLFWRVWMTRKTTARYLAGQNYLRLKKLAVFENPDQRIADDVRAFTHTALSFGLMFLNGVLAIVSFAGVLWTISPLLFSVAVGYAAMGTLAVIYFGRPLVGLNYRQSDQEANFRSDLIHLRENAESVALLRREDRLTARLLKRVDSLAENFRRITDFNRNLSFFTTGYGYLIQIIPVLIVAPLFIRGEVEFGVITQSAMAFAHLVGAFSLIINEIQGLSIFAAVIARVGALGEAVDGLLKSDTTGVRTVATDDRLGYEGLTLFEPASGKALIKDLSLDYPRDKRILIAGPNEAAKAALFLATADMWRSGMGKVYRPCPDAICFLPHRPYLPPGTLRQILFRTGQERAVPDKVVLKALDDAGLRSVLERAGGLDVEHDWSGVLSLREQHQLAVTRVILARPEFTILDRVDSVLNQAQLRRSLELMAENGIACVLFAESPEPVEWYDAVLEIDANGAWRWRIDPKIDVRRALVEHDRTKADTKDRQLTSLDHAPHSAFGALPALGEV
jgi:putative ATP-binding cassette transporter